MTKLELDSISKAFTDGDGDRLQVLEDLSFVVEEGSFTSLMGPSGCGKSTVMNIIAGILEIDSGVIKQDNQPKRQDELSCSYVFQEPRLLEWSTVAKNIDITLRAQGHDKTERERRIADHLERVGLAGEENSYPGELSGGMQQRVGIARALAVDSDIILMDEPFSSLDEITASKLRADLLDIWSGTEKTILFVTHNMREAINLSDRILFLEPGEGIFREEEITIPRPRSMEDTNLMEKEAELTAAMSDKVTHNL